VTYELERQKRKTMREMNKLTKDRKVFSRWTADPDSARWQGIGKEEEEEEKDLPLPILCWAVSITSPVFDSGQWTMSKNNIGYRFSSATFFLGFLSQCFHVNQVT
jgi:hypothetical protein